MRLGKVAWPETVATAAGASARTYWRQCGIQVYAVALTPLEEPTPIAVPRPQGSAASVVTAGAAPWCRDPAIEVRDCCAVPTDASLIVYGDSVGTYTSFSCWRINRPFRLFRRRSSQRAAGRLVCPSNDASPSVTARPVAQVGCAFGDSRGAEEKPLGL